MSNMNKDGGKRKCIKSFKHPRIVVDGFMYHFHKKCSRHLRWKCNRVFSMKCPSILKTTTDLDNLKVVGIDHDHIHSDDTSNILYVQNRLANQKEKFRGDPTKQSTMVILNISDVFDHKNGKRLQPYINESTIQEYSQNSCTNVDSSSNIEESQHLNSENNSVNLTSQNEIEMDGVDVEHNMHCSTSHINTEIHSQVHEEIKSKCSCIENKFDKNISFKQNSNRVFEISDDDDNYVFDCNDTQIDTVTSSGENLINMIEEKNSLVVFEDDDQTKLTYPCQDNVPASMALPSSEKSVTSQSTKSVLGIQQKPYTCQLTTENVNSNETISQRSSTLPMSCSKQEIEVARIHSSKGVVSISLVNGPNPASTNPNPFYGSLNEICSKPPQTTSVSSKLPLKKNPGLNNSSITVSSVQNKKELHDVVKHAFIDLTDDDNGNKVDCVGIENTFSTLQPVPESIPIPDDQDDLQQAPETNQLVISNTVPTPKLKVIVPSNWVARTIRKNSSNVELILSFDSYDKDNRTVKSCILYSYQKYKNESSGKPPNWRLVGELIPTSFPAQCFVRVDNLGKNDIYFSARAKDFSGQFGDSCEPVFVKIKSK